MKDIRSLSMLTMLICWVKT